MLSPPVDSSIDSARLISPNSFVLSSLCNRNIFKQVFIPFTSKDLRLLNQTKGRPVSWPSLGSIKTYMAAEIATLLWAKLVVLEELR